MSKRSRALSDLERLPEDLPVLEFRNSYYDTSPTRELNLIDQDKRRRKIKRLSSGSSSAAGSDEVVRLSRRLAEVSRERDEESRGRAEEARRRRDAEARNGYLQTFQSIQLDMLVTLGMCIFSAVAPRALAALYIVYASWRCATCFGGRSSGAATRWPRPWPWRAWPSSPRSCA